VRSPSFMEEPEAEFDFSVHHVAPELQPGDKCAIHPGDRMATVMFIGPVASMPAGYWVGVQYEEKVGKNDGTLNGRRYFTCPPGYGGFLRATRVNKVEDRERETRAQELEEAQGLAMEEANAKKSKKKKGSKSARPRKRSSAVAASLVLMERLPSQQQLMWRWRQLRHLLPQRQRRRKIRPRALARRRQRAKKLRMMHSKRSIIGCPKHLGEHSSTSKHHVRQIVSVMLICSVERGCGSEL
jgi:hypothetical protein